MFYSDVLLQRKGPLAHVWLAANLERKLSRNQFLSANIQESVGAIVHETDGPFALRLSGQLLLGLARIYSRQAKYLMDDCNEISYRIKTAFKPGSVEISVNASSSSKSQNLTLQNTVTSLDLSLPDLPFDLAMPTNMSTNAANSLVPNALFQGVDKNISRVSDITLEDMSLEVGRGDDGDNDMDNIMGEDIGIDFSFDGADGADHSVEQGRDIAVAHPKTQASFDLDFGGDQSFIGEDFGHNALDNLPTGENEDMYFNDSANMSGLLPQSTENRQTKRRRKINTITVADPDPSIQLSQRSLQALRRDRSRILKPHNILLPFDPSLTQTLIMAANTSSYVEFVYSLSSTASCAGFSSCPRDAAKLYSHDKKELGTQVETQVGTQHASTPVPAIDFGGDVDFEYGENDFGGFEDYGDESMALSISDSPDKTIENLATNSYGVSRQTVETVSKLKTNLPSTSSKTTFSKVLDDNSRSEKAKVFFELLVLATKDALKVEQPEQYGDITIQAKSKLYEPDFEGFDSSSPRGSLISV